jgi:hypothetical protein
VKSKKFSVTERGTFKRCRDQWDYSSFSRQGLTPRAASKALSAGTIHHRVMDVWCKHLLLQKENSLLADFNTSEGTDTVCAEFIQTIAEKYKREVGVKISRIELDPVFEAIEFERAMIKLYEDYWGSPIEEGFELVQAEQTIVVPVCQAPCNECNGSGTQGVDNKLGLPLWASCLACDGEGLVQLELEGTLDAVVTKDERYYVVERKTYDKRPSLDYLRFFDQGTVYVWMMNQLQLGEVAGIAYDGMWRRKEPPKGHELADLFLRTLLLRNEYEMRTIGPQLIRELRDMNSAELYPNRRWEGCHDCGYRKLCDAHTLGEDTEAIRERYYTLREKTPAFAAIEEPA